MLFRSWYKFLSEVVDQRLNEIHQKVLDRTRISKYLRLSGEDSKQLNSIFEGKKRIAISFEGQDYDETDLKLLSYIDELRKAGWTVNLSEPFGYATKEYESKVGDKVYKNKKKVKIGPLIVALGPEAAKFWQHNNKFYTTKANELHFATKYSIIISRAPMDILRMSDHDGWDSCHSTGGSYFKCAIEESVSGGAIAYIVNSKDLDKIDLEASEIFRDSARKIGRAHV